MHYYPLPESLNFSNISTLYCPQLIFGSLSSSTILRHIRTYYHRPYLGFLPGYKSNYHFPHGEFAEVMQGWVHEFFHSVLDIRVNSTLRMSERDFPDRAIPSDEMMRNYMTTQLSVAKSGGDDDAAAAAAAVSDEKVAQFLTDYYFVHHSPFVGFRGGGPVRCGPGRPPARPSAKSKKKTRRESKRKEIISKRK